MCIIRERAAQGINMKSIESWLLTDVLPAVMNFRERRKKKYGWIDHFDGNMLLPMMINNGGIPNVLM